MTILHLSDTHGKHHLLKYLPLADIIVHSGDVSEDGTESEVLDFLNWFCDLDYRHKIFIAGNHDFCLESAQQIEDLLQACLYLCNPCRKFARNIICSDTFIQATELKIRNTQLLSTPHL